MAEGRGECGQLAGIRLASSQEATVGVHVEGLENGSITFLNSFRESGKSMLNQVWRGSLLFGQKAAGQKIAQCLITFMGYSKEGDPASKTFSA